MVARISVIFKIKFSTSGVAHGDALLREELPQKMFSFGHFLKRGGGEVIRAMPKRKHFFFREGFPYTSPQDNLTKHTGTGHLSPIASSTVSLSIFYPQIAVFGETIWCPFGDECG